MRLLIILNLILTFVITCLLLGCDHAESENLSGAESKTPEDVVEPIVPSHPIVAAARSQIGKTVIYDGAYVGLDYPGGDIPLERGVCTDVVVRALRKSHNLDLQKLLYMDMSRAFAKYPTTWGLKRPDRNIDHRRVPNLRTFFERMGYALEITSNSENFQPGDLVTCTVGGNRPHVMIVSDRKSPKEVPFVIHNIGSGTQEEDLLFAFPITGHYRIPERE